jgi:hypothetical protein
MTFQSFKVAAKIGLPVLMVAFALPAFAEDVTFTTTGAFSCGAPGTCALSTYDGTSDAQMVIKNHNNTFTIQASGYTEANVLAGDPNNDDVNAINFNTAVAKTGKQDPVNTTGAGFTLTITQTSPPANPDSQSLTGAFSGTITSAQTGVVVTFGGGASAPLDSVVIGNITYTLDSNVWTIPNPGNGTIGMTAETTTVTPEPTFMMLTGLGFAALGFVAYRRKRTA